jgi:hypothetical protein
LIRMPSCGSIISRRSELSSGRRKVRIWMCIRLVRHQMSRLCRNISTWIMHISSCLCWLRRWSRQVSSSGIRMPVDSWLCWVKTRNRHVSSRWSRVPVINTMPVISRWSTFWQYSNWQEQCSQFLNLQQNTTNENKYW